MSHKESGRLCSFPPPPLPLPPLPPLPSSPPPQRTACQSRKKGRFDSNENRLSNHLALSSPDKGEEGCVRKSRGAAWRLESWLLVLTWPFPQHATLLDLHLSTGGLPPPQWLCLCEKHISMGCIKNGIRGPRHGPAAKGSPLLAWPPAFNPREPQSRRTDSRSLKLSYNLHACALAHR